MRKNRGENIVHREKSEKDKAKNVIIERGIDREREREREREEEEEEEEEEDEGK